LSKPDIIEMNPITESEMLDELKKIKKRDGELNFRANKSDDFLNHFKLLKKSDIKEMYSKFDELDINRLKPEHIVKIIDLLPSSEEDLKLVLSGFNLTLPKDSLTKILDVVKGYK